MIPALQKNQILLEICSIVSLFFQYAAYLLLVFLLVKIDFYPHIISCSCKVTQNMSMRGGILVKKSNDTYNHIQIVVKTCS